MTAVALLTAMPATAATGSSTTPLLNSRSTTVKGTPSIFSCNYRLPPLRLQPWQRAIERRHSTVDPSTCTARIETGTPARSTLSENGSFDAEPAIPERPGDVLEDPGPGGGGARSSGYYEVRWEDAVNIDLTKTRANLTWTWNQLCATSPDNSGYWWWGAGWHLDDPASFAVATSSGCNYQETYAKGLFWNTVFCGYEVDIFVIYAHVRGWYTGALSGFVDSTWNNGSCAPLHWEESLVRTG
jgi:hypothetical protein